jgi:excisionase family DNA binding protein
MDEQERRVYTLDETAQALGLHRNTVSEMVNAGAIRARKAGNRWLVPASALEEFLAGRDNPRRVYSASEVAAVLGLHVNTVAQLLRAGSIRARKVGRDWKIPHDALEEYLAGRDNPRDEGQE